MQPSGTWLADSVMSEATPFTMPATVPSSSAWVYRRMAASILSASSQQFSAVYSSVHGSASSRYIWPAVL